jgi:single-strand DNA-binding protein
MILLVAVGNLGKDCVVNDVNGKKVINFNVAHTEKYKDRSGTTMNKTTWMECAYWTDRTAIAPYLKKGTLVSITGQPEVRLYQKNDGKYGASLAVRVTNITLLGSKKDEDNSGSSDAQDSNNPYNNSGNNSEISEPVDDLPF